MSFAIAEVIAALVGNSLSLLGDAATMIVDALTYGFNLIVRAHAYTSSVRMVVAPFLCPFTRIIDGTIVVVGRTGGTVVVAAA